MSVTEIEQKKLSRRKVLKGFGMGAAVAWTAPMLFSTTEAWALPGVGGKTCAQNALGGGSGAATCTPCPACNNICKGAPNCTCACFTRVNGCCSCNVNASCSGAQTCRVQSDCPTGTQCVYTCCDGIGFPGFRCLAKCTPGVAASVAAIPQGTRRAGSLN